MSACEVYADFHNPMAKCGECAGCLRERLEEAAGWVQALRDEVSRLKEERDEAERLRQEGAEALEAAQVREARYQRQLQDLQLELDDARREIEDLRVRFVAPGPRAS